jgi:hypothetical protein
MHVLHALNSLPTSRHKRDTVRGHDHAGVLEEGHSIMDLHMRCQVLEGRLSTMPSNTTWVNLCCSPKNRINATTEHIPGDAQ